jgi:putative membrane protein
VQAHQSTVATFQRQLPAIADPDLRNWVLKTLPVVEHHLGMAQDMAGRIAG